MRRSSGHGDLGGGVALFTLLLIGGWALGPLAPIAALALGIFLVLAGLKSILSGSFILAFMGFSGMGLGVFSFMVGIKLFEVGFGM